jgi:ATP-dependent Clp protease ATP-binding subunit ClpA
MDQVKNFIDLVVSGQNVEAKSTLENLISSRAFEALDDKKRELASNLFGGNSDVGQTEE